MSELLEAAEALVAELEHGARPSLFRTPWGIGGTFPYYQPELDALKAAIRPERESIDAIDRDRVAFRDKHGRNPDLREAMIMASQRFCREAGPGENLQLWDFRK